MKKRVFALLLVCVMLLGVLAACGKQGAVNEKQAQKIALTHAGLSTKDITDIHTHIVEEGGVPCYSFHITTADAEFSVIVDAATGEVIE